MLAVVGVQNGFCLLCSHMMNIVFTDLLSAVFIQCGVVVMAKIMLTAFIMLLMFYDFHNAISYKICYSFIMLMFRMLCW